MDNLDIEALILEYNCYKVPHGSMVNDLYISIFKLTKDETGLVWSIDRTISTEVSVNEDDEDYLDVYKNYSKKQCPYIQIRLIRNSLEDKHMFYDGDLDRQDW